MHHTILSRLIWHRVGLNHGYNIQSTIHALLSSALGISGLITGDYNFYSKLINHVTTGYFISDCFNENLGEDLIFHHLAGIYVLNMLVEKYPYSPILCQGILIELSTPFLNEFRRTKKKGYGIGLLISFALLRVLYLPWIYQQFLIRDDPELSQNIRYLVWTFISLNYFWFYKICRIAYNIKK